MNYIVSYWRWKEGAWMREEFIVSHNEPIRIEDIDTVFMDAITVREE